MQPRRVVSRFHAAELIQSDHRALAAVLRALRASLDATPADGNPDFDALRAMLFYMDEVPVRVHHANENTLLFPRIRERCPALRPVLDRLEAEHERGEEAVRDLERALTAWEVMGRERRESFELLLRAYVSGYLGHMEVEEDYVLPVAEEYLSRDDWHELDAAFLKQREALHGAAMQQHQALFDRILSGSSTS